jgi:hypothetical protein
VLITLRRLTVPAVGLLVAALTLGSATTPAQAEGDDTSSPAAAAALDQVQAILDPTPAEQATQATQATDGGRELTLALRDLRLRQGELSKRDRAVAKRIAPTRPNADLFQDFGSVRVHWMSTDTSVTAAWVNEVGSVVTHVLSTYRAAGYRAPMSDGLDGGGSGLLDIYLVDFNAAGEPGLYGFCDAAVVPPPKGPYNTSAYCAFDHDFAGFPQRTPSDNLKVTAAHELFHAVQFAYDYNEDAWFMEATATWAEDEVYSSINDNRQYLAASPMSQPRQSLDQFSQNSLRQYGEWIFFRYLTEHFKKSQGGLPLIIRQMWQRADGAAGGRDNYSIQAVNGVLKAYGTDLRQMYAAFGDANRRPAKTYSEGSHYRKAAAFRTWRFNTVRHSTGLQSTRLNHLSTTTVAVVPSKAMKRWKLRATVNLPNTKLGVAAILTRYNKAGHATRKVVHLSKTGSGRATVTFDARNTSKVELTLSNAGIRYGHCWSGPSGGILYSCAGVSKDDKRTMAYRLSAVR